MLIIERNGSGASVYEGGDNAVVDELYDVLAAIKPGCVAHRASPRALVLTSPPVKGARSPNRTLVFLILSSRVWW